MSSISTKTRNSLHKAEFGLPATRQYPMPDRAHAANAKARAAQEYNAGNLSANQKAQIDAKANKILKRK
jgi:hypothetical protein